MKRYFLLIHLEGGGVMRSCWVGSKCLRVAKKELARKQRALPDTEITLEMEVL